MPGDGCERLKTSRSKGQEDDNGLVIRVQIFPFSLEKKTQMTAKVLEYYMICETCLFNSIFGNMNSSTLVFKLLG